MRRWWATRPGGCVLRGGHLGGVPRSAAKYSGPRSLRCPLRPPAGSITLASEPIPACWVRWDLSRRVTSVDEHLLLLVHARKQQHGSTNSSRCFSSGVFWRPGGCPFEIRESTARVLSETKKRPPPACRTLASGPRPACWVRWDLSVRGKSSMLHLKLSTLNRRSAVTQLPSQYWQHL